MHIRLSFCIAHILHPLAGSPEPEESSDEPPIIVRDSPPPGCVCAGVSNEGKGHHCHVWDDDWGGAFRAILAGFRVSLVMVKLYTFIQPILFGLFSFVPSFASCHYRGGKNFCREKILWEKFCPKLGQNFSRPS